MRRIYTTNTPITLLNPLFPEINGRDNDISCTPRRTCVAQASLSAGSRPHLLPAGKTKTGPEGPVSLFQPDCDQNVCFTPSV